MEGPPARSTPTTNPQTTTANNALLSVTLTFTATFPSVSPPGADPGMEVMVSRSPLTVVAMRSNTSAGASTSRAGVLPWTMETVKRARMSVWMTCVTASVMLAERSSLSARAGPRAAAARARRRQREGRLAVGGGGWRRGKYVGKRLD